MLKRLMVLFGCLVAYICSVNGSSDNLSEWLKHRAQLSASRSNRAPHADIQKVRRDTSSNDALTKAYLEELIKELKQLNYIRDSRYVDDDFEDKAFVTKRKGFWSTMGGPLPVETRLASFGSRIEPDPNASSPNGFKAMRYGRR